MGHSISDEQMASTLLSSFGLCVNIYIKLAYPENVSFCNLSDLSRGKIAFSGARKSGNI